MSSTSDPFRITSNPSQRSVLDARDCKEEASNLWRTFDDLQRVYPQGARELALAKTKLEEAIMWATKGVTAP